MGLLHTLCVVAVVGVTFHATLFDTIPGGDSGELVAEACALGTPHPPGYETHTQRHAQRE